MATYEVETEGGTYQVETEDPTPMTLKGAAENLGKDIVDTGKSVFNMAKPVIDPLGIGEAAFKGSLDPIMDRATGKTGLETLKMAKNLPGALVDEGKRVGLGELVTGHPINAAEKFGRAAYDKPLTTGLDVASVVSPFMKGKVPVAEGMPVSPKISPIQEMGSSLSADKPLMVKDFPGGAASGDIKGIAVKHGDNIFSETPGKNDVWMHSDIFEKNKIPFEEGIPGFVDKNGRFVYQYEGDIKGAPSSSVVPDVDRFLEKRYGRTKDLKSNDMLEGFRDLASHRGAVHNINDLVNQLDATVGKKYLSQPIYENFLSDLKKRGPNQSSKFVPASEIAEKIKQIKEPTLANELNKINESLIKENLNPSELETYNSLSEKMVHSLADDLVRGTPKAPDPLNIGNEAASILKEPIPPKVTPPPTPPPEMGTFETLKGKIPRDVLDPMKEVNNYLMEKYGEASAKPGFADTIGELLTRKAKTMRLKEMGMSPGQARKIIEKFGEDKLLELSDVAKDKGITKPVVGYKVGQNIDKLHETSGQTIGSIRELAAKRGAAHNPNELVDAIRSELDKDYLGTGVKSGQKGTYMKALQDIKTAATTPDVLAEKITDLNKFSTKNKMNQATGAISDVANAASRANNNLIKSVLNPQEAEAYQTALKDFGSSQLFKRFYGFKAGREFAGRSGVGGMIKNMYQWGMDTFGNKFIENVSEGIGNKIKKNPSLTSNPKILMDEVLKQMADTLDEIGDEFVQ